jgi:hypothetical protein
MNQVYRDIYVGDDEDFEKVKGKEDWSIVRACKEGPGGHREAIGYHTQGAPKGPDYLFVKKKNLLSLNLIDVDNPDFIPDELIEEALKFIKDERAKDRKVLIACNAGVSRSPSIALLYLYVEGKLPRPYPQAVRMFRKLYPKYDPSAGIHIFTRRKISQIRANNG